ncbi:MAG: lipoyl-dependent peroxiredoxin [Miltoncostaeaceae bacterium]|jgi:osmotically inducible protein OsmC|nr:lipoyl-dependent peroxiredoxin [Miltoncostaeaceae bacterium]
MAADRRAEVTWEGELQTGKGEVTLASSGSGTFPVSWPSRTEEPDGRTSPEELLAGAHAACFAMAFSGGLGRAGTPPERLDVTATVTFVPGTGVTTSKLVVRGVVPGLDQAGFAEAAEAAEGRCPVSNAIRGNVEVTMEATLAS